MPRKVMWLLSKGHLDGGVHITLENKQAQQAKLYTHMPNVETATFTQQILRKNQTMPKITDLCQDYKGTKLCYSQ